MTRFYVLFALALVGLAAHAEGTTAFPYARKARYQAPFAQRDLLAPRATHPQRLRRAEAKTFSCGDNYGYMNGPHGTHWFYTMAYTTEEHLVEGGYGQTEASTTGYTITVYNERFESVGTVSDTICLPEGARQVAQVMVDPTVSQKFFNIDTNYEIIVSLVYNYADYSLTYESKIYSVGQTGVVATLPGYCVDAIDVAQDAWSENFFLTFLTEESGSLDEATDLNAYLSSCRHILTTYKKAGWGSGPSAISTLAVGQGNTPGSEGNVPFFASTAKDGKAYFVVQEYEKWFFADPTGMSGDESATPDNRLLVRVYSATPYASAFTLEQETAIAMAQPTEAGTLYNFYGIGELAGTDDFLFEPDGLGFLVTVEGYQSSSDECLNSYYLYGPDGSLRSTLAEKTYSAAVMSDLKGQPRQLLFITTDDDEVSHTFHFVDLLRDADGHPFGEPVTDIPQTIGEVELSGYLDRAAVGDTYQYCAQLNGATADEALNTYDHVGWIRTDGTVDHVDLNNLGPRIALAQAYIAGPALSPYIFNTDSEREYMYLVKRYIGAATSSETQEELLVVNPHSQTLLQLLPQADKGDLQLISLLIEGDHNALLTTYNKNYHYTAEVRDLPLTQFAGGSGTADDPYLIATVGDLQQMRHNPAAHYALAGDIEALGFDFQTIAATFTGELDGRGHLVRDLSLEGPILRDMGQGACVKNLTLADTRIAVSGDNAAVVCGSMLGANIYNVWLHGLVAEGTGESEFGAIAHDASLGSEIASCYVLQAAIHTPAGSAAGIVGTLRTGSRVLASAFQGTIEGYTDVAGIASQTVTGDERIEDCHTRAQLTAQNTVGGIVATTNRSLVARCMAEGAITATANTHRWGDNGPQAAGIAAYVEPNFDETINDTVLRHSLVLLDSIKGYTPAEAPAYESQHNTLHRVAGYTLQSAEPDITDYDRDDNPIYGALNSADRGFFQNYALDLLPATDAKGHATTEGDDIAREAITPEFLAETLHFAFGTTTAAPWAQDEDGTIKLYFELAAADGLTAPAATSRPHASALYDLQGRRVPRAQKGIYIKDGKKIAVR